jgi:hypothetical protein
MRPVSYEVNQKHVDEPIPGDYWDEMLVLYHVVLKVLPNGNRVIAERDRTVTDGQRPDLSQAFEITKADHRKKVTYSVDKLGFVACVTTGNKIALGWITEWATEFGGRYKELATSE